MKPQPAPPLTSAEAAHLQVLVQRHCGLLVDERKLAIVLRQAWEALLAAGCQDMGALLRALSAEASPLWPVLIPFLTTNETYFLREPGQLQDFVELALPGLRSRLAGRAGHGLQVLSAGCSSGEEAYTLAALLAEAGVDGHVTAIDLDPRVLQQAREARYGPNSFRGVPPAWRESHFHAVGARAWEVRPALRARVSFGEGNLLQVQEALAGRRFDAIFCRNVLIYFARPTQLEVVRQLRSLLVPGGYLLLGHSELFFQVDLGLAIHRSSRATMFQNGGVA